MYDIRDLNLMRGAAENDKVKVSRTYLSQTIQVRGLLADFNLISQTERDTTINQQTCWSHKEEWARQEIQCHSSSPQCFSSSKLQQEASPIPGSTVKAPLKDPGLLVSIFIFKRVNWNKVQGPRQRGLTFLLSGMVRGLSKAFLVL